MERNGADPLTPEEIGRYNEMICRTLGDRARLYDVDGLCRPVARRELMEWIARETPERRPAFCGQNAITEADWADWEQNRALDALPHEILPQRGVCVRRGSLRALPTAEHITAQPDDRYDDLLQLTAVLPCEPLAVFCASADGRYYFAAAYFHMGWIAAEEIGLCGAADWSAARREDFLRVTGSAVTLCADPYEPRVSERRFPMGTRLPLAAPVGTVRALRHRMSYDCCCVLVPARGADGGLEWVEALVPCSADVSVGDLPYTDGAAVELAQKMCGEAYGWGGLLGARDCSALVGDVYRCFGFLLPRNSGDLARLPHGISLEGLTDGEKRKRLQAMPTGAILYFPGHIMLWLGEREGCPLCLSAAGNFLPVGSAGGVPRAVNTVAATSLDVVRANGNTWLASLTRAVWPRL